MACNCIHLTGSTLLCHYALAARCAYMTLVGCCRCLFFFFISIFFGMQCAVDPNDIKVIQYACNSFITRSCCWRLATRCALNQSSLGMVIFDRYCTSFRKCIYTCTLFCLFQCYANKMSIFALDFVCVIAHKFDERLYCVFHIQNTRFNCSYWTFN